MTPSQRFADRLLDCEQTIRTLQEENRHLRRAALALGALAERLSTALTVERRATEQWMSAMGHQPDIPRPGARQAQAARLAAVATHGY